MHKEMNTVHFNRILVVDDTTANLQLLTNLLTEHDYTVYPASDGELALEFVRSTLPDLILLDIRMPGMDGYEVCRRLKSDERTRSVPIIFISILEDERDKVKGFQAGAADYITKPFQPEEVLARVRVHLRLRELTEHLEQTVAERTEELMIAKERLQQELAERKRAEEDRNLAEKALAESEELHRITIENISDPVFMTDDIGNFTFICPNIPHSLGFSVKEIEAMSNISTILGENLFTPEDLNRQGKISNIETVIFDKNGRKRDYLVTVKRVSIKGSTILYVGRDITERKRAEESLLERESFLNTLLNAIPIPVFYKDRKGRYMGFNSAFETFFGATKEQLIGKSVFEISPPELAGTYHAKDNEIFGNGVEQQYEYQVKNTHGVTRDVIFNKAVFTDSRGAVSGLIGTILDISERKRMEDMLRQSEHNKTIQNQIAKIFLTIPDEDMYGEVLAVVLQAMESRFGVFGFIGANGDLVFPSMTREIWNECQVPGKSVIFLQDTWGDSLWGKAIREQRALYSDGPFHTPAGHIRIDHFLTAPIIFGNETIGLLSVSNKERGYTGEDRGLLENIAGYISPILNARLQRDRQEQGRKRAEEEREKMQAQLLQAQKMESVGRLAGGVAHDFNNMLSVILGRAEMALDNADLSEPICNDLQEIRKAAERSANLTRQLLTFARRQTVAPKVIDLNETVESMLRLLRRLIGEDISLAWMPGAGLWQVKVDISQIDQIMANLCVNARDAIAGVGKVTIETENAVFDETYCADHADTAVGEYVLLAVSDNGCGMNRETLSKLFEPFFTTKEVGKGTGLGLSTVYGIVRQNNGFINVCSEPGHGTTFRIYLPRHAAGTEQMRKEIPASPTARCHETILLVEDESAIMDLVKLMLESLGYRVLAALTPGEAIRIAREHSGGIHLLITDVVMPEMTGRDLAKNLNSLCPGLRCLFMSGYTGDVIAHHGVLDDGVSFIQKPFSKQSLAARVREVLNSK